MFLSKEGAIPYAQNPSVSREDIASTSGNNSLSEQLTFMILDVTLKSFPKINAIGVVYYASFFLQLKRKTTVLISRNALQHLKTT